MAVGLAFAAGALRTGLRIRSSRVQRVRREPDLRRKHLRLAKTAVVLVLVGSVGGPLSMVFLRGRPPFATAHAWVGLSAVVLFAATAWFGRELEQNRRRERDTHAALALLSALAAAAAFVTGFVLLP